MAEHADRYCQWCKKVIGIATPEGVIDIADVTEFEGRFYCSGRSGTCWDDLLAMAKYVQDNFSESGKAS